MCERSKSSRRHVAVGVGDVGEVGGVVGQKREREREREREGKKERERKRERETERREGRIMAIEKQTRAKYFLQFHPLSSHKRSFWVESDTSSDKFYHVLRFEKVLCLNHPLFCISMCVLTALNTTIRHPSCADAFVRRATRRVCDCGTALCDRQTGMKCGLRAC
jgi:hypothetical protein